MADAAPQQLGKYRLGQLIATGGMGEVFLAKNEGPAGFAKTVVLKKILPHLARDPQFVDMFLNEARLAALLSHPNIVQIFELGQEQDTYFIAMEFIHGRSLRAIKQKLLERKQLFSPILASRLCSHALQGLQYAHTLTDESGAPLNVVHRDISPDNVLVSFNGQVKLVDFGIAKAANAVTTTRTGTIKGKYAYMAPEQLMGGAADGRIDVYATGVLMYELLTGTRPYTAPTEPALITAILNTQPQPPKERNPALPEEINAIILKALEKDPNKRFANAEEMSTALEAFVTSTGQTLTAGNVGAFLKDLFASELAAGTPQATGKPPTNPSNASLKSSTPSSQLSSKPKTGPSGVLPNTSAVVAPAPANVVQAELGGTPVSKAAKDLLRDMETAAIPSPVEANEAATVAATNEEISGVVAKAATGSKAQTTAVVGRSTPTLPQVEASGESAAPATAFGGNKKMLAIGGAVGALVLIVGVGAFVLARGSADAQVPVPKPITHHDDAQQPSQPSQPIAVAPKKDPAPVPADPPQPAKVPDPVPAKVDPPVVAAKTPDPVTPPPNPAIEKKQSAHATSAPKSKSPGKVAFRVNPWAEVFFEGKSLGITPMPAVAVPAGKQTFTLKNSEIGVSKKVTVNVPSGGDAVVKADLFE